MVAKPPVPTITSEIGPVNSDDLFVPKLEAPLACEGADFVTHRLGRRFQWGCRFAALLRPADLAQCLVHFRHVKFLGVERAAGPTPQVSEAFMVGLKDYLEEIPVSHWPTDIFRWASALSRDAHWFC